MTKVSLIEFRFAYAGALSILLIFSSSTRGQGRVILNNNPFIVIQDAAQLVLDNDQTHALVTSGTGGNILSEGENNRIVWRIAESTGSYVIPFTTKSGKKIPLVLDVSNSGNGTQGRVGFSTYETATDDNQPWASDLTHMNFNGTNATLSVVDRFWFIDAISYAVKPSANMTLSYDDSPNEIGGANTINESSLVAQRWNNTDSTWGGAQFGSSNPSLNEVNNIFISPSDFHKTWVLSSSSSPLPVTLLFFDAECIDGLLRFTWSTATETNNSHFVIQQSEDLANWLDVGSAQGNGFSASTLEYSMDLPKVGEGDYYRLKQVDHDGNAETFEAVFEPCEGNSESRFWIYPNPNSGAFNLQSNEDVTGMYALFDPTGKVVRSGSINGRRTAINVLVAPGVYQLLIKSGHHVKQLRTVIQ